jgi:hypothetical protein
MPVAAGAAVKMEAGAPFEAPTVTITMTADMAINFRIFMLNLSLIQDCRQVN